MLHNVFEWLTEKYKKKKRKKELCTFCRSKRDLMFLSLWQTTKKAPLCELFFTGMDSTLSVEWQQNLQISLLWQPFYAVQLNVNYKGLVPIQCTHHVNSKELVPIQCTRHVDHKN